MLSVREKQGRSGPLTFVVVGQQIRQDGTVVIDERRDIVSRGPSRCGPLRPRPTGQLTTGQ